MPLILNQQRYALEFDDIIGDRYHYPEQYASYIQTGEIFIYYHPSEKPLDPHIYYFGRSTVRGKHTRPLGELTAAFIYIEPPIGRSDSRRGRASARL